MDLIYFNHNIDQSTLCEIGVDTTLVDLEEEVENVGIWVGLK